MIGAGHAHERVECASCGAVLAQCRCMEGGRNVRKVPGPCAACRDRKPNPAAHVDDLIETVREVAKETGTPLTQQEEHALAGIVREQIGPCPCEVCVARRKEPFLAPCFDVGAQWYSDDDGLSWVRFPVMRARPRPSRTLTVIAINATSGEVTFKVSR